MTLAKRLTSHLVTRWSFILRHHDLRIRLYTTAEGQQQGQLSIRQEQSVAQGSIKAVRTAMLG
jgi:hypothetical protein